jgi:hypothetical protein
MVNELRAVHPNLWHNRAAFARLSTELLGDQKAKDHQLKLTQLYERLARYAEERVRAR